MKITILCVGKLKEKYWLQAIAEYTKRLSGYAKIQILEVPDEPTREKASEAEDLLVKSKEGERILKVLEKQGRAYLIALAINGTSYDSVSFSDHLQHVFLQGYNHLIFMIGGSLGLSDDVLKKANERLSFSAFTFPHQLMRVILLEQLYRAQRIAAGEPYHK